MDRPEGTSPDGASSPAGPLPNRFTRATALGCLGIAGVLLLPAVFFLPLENWHGPNWVVQAIWLVAFAALAGGVWLLARVPAASTRMTSDPRRPVTHAGRAPIRETPASRGNRVVLCALGGLVAIAAISYVGASAAANATDFGASVAVASLTGGVAVALGVGVAWRRLPPPAWSWVRSAIRGGASSPLPQGLGIVLFGAAVLGWALLAAADHRFAWGALGLAVLVVASVAITPLASRWPARWSDRGQWSDASADGRGATPPGRSGNPSDSAGPRDSPNEHA